MLFVILQWNGGGGCNNFFVLKYVLHQLVNSY